MQSSKRAFSTISLFIKGFGTTEKTVIYEWYLKKQQSCAIGKICQVWQTPVFGPNFELITTFGRVRFISIYW
jgi:hypothetical protein